MIKQFDVSGHHSMSTYFQPSFLVSPGREVGYGCANQAAISQERLKIEVKLLLRAHRKPYMPRRLAQQRMTSSDLEQPFHGSSIPSVWEARANVNALCTSSTLKSTSSASRAISAIADFFCTPFYIIFPTCYRQGAITSPNSQVTKYTPPCCRSSYALYVKQIRRSKYINEHAQAQ